MEEEREREIVFLFLCVGVCVCVLVSSWVCALLSSWVCTLVRGIFIIIYIEMESFTGRVHIHFRTETNSKEDLMLENQYHCSSTEDSYAQQIELVSGCLQMSDLPVTILCFELIPSEIPFLIKGSHRA